MYFLVLKWTRLFARLRVHSDFGQSAFHISGYGTLIHGPSSGAALVRTFSSSSIRRSLAIKSHELDAKRQAWSRIRTAVVTSAVLAAILQSSDDFFSFIYSMPKTFRAVWWAFKAGLSYKHFLTLYLDHSSDEFSKAISQLHDYWADKLLQVCRSNGGVYIKAGQFAGAFGAVPLEYRVKLSSLQDRAQPRPYSRIRKHLLRELGADGLALFAEFDTQATAAASLAQVHRARLLTGEAVAVKVQYPGLATAVHADLTTMRWLSSLAAWAFPEYQLDWLVTEIDAKLAVELDFRNEVSNAAHLSQVLAAAKNRSVTVPRVYGHLSTPRVITMEWIDGLKINDVSSLRAADVNPRAVGLELVKLFAQLTFQHGYIHADPHPGNLMVRTKAKGKGLLSWILTGTKQPFELVLLDHGTYLQITPELRQAYCQLWCALLSGDKASAAEVATSLGGARAGQVLPVILTQRATNRAESAQMQKAAGLSGLGDMTRLLAASSREVVELLRIDSVIRSTASQLGCTMADRLRIFGQHAFGGLPSHGTAAAASMHAAFRSGWARAALFVRLGSMEVVLWARLVAERTLSVVVGIIDEAIFQD